MVYLMDPATGTGMSQDHQFLAQAISERYPQFRLAQVPLSNREKNEEFPFAILFAPTGEVVKELRENEMNINIIFTWLYMNDSNIHGSDKLYKRFEDAKKKAEDDRLHESKERMKQDLDIVHTIANSALHTFRHGGRKFG